MSFEGAFGGAFSTLLYIWERAFRENRKRLKLLTIFTTERFILSWSYVKRFIWYNLYDSQSVFKFSLRFQHHTSCSYQAHKSCPYGIFSLQEFKQNDSRTSSSSSSSSSNYCTNFREKNVKENEWGKSLCVKPGLKRRKNLEFYKTLLAELRLKDEYDYNILLRMTSVNLEEIFQLIKDDLTKENTKMRELISPRI